MDHASSSAELQRLLDLLGAGHDSAREPLLLHGLERFRHLAQRMFRRQSDLRKLDETDDVVQKALVRLHRALAQVKPPTVRDFFGLAARQIRWVLRDLAREMASARPLAYTDPTAPDEGPHDPGGGPSDLLEWGVFHEKIDGLPDEERELFDLLLYQGLTQPEAAEMLQTPLRTIKRRWQRARLRLCETLRGEWPGLEG